MKYIYIVIAICIFSSCDWLKQKTKEIVNKSGEVIAKTGSEFIDGVSKGVEKTFQNEVVFSEALKTKGLKAGKIIIISTDSISFMTKASNKKSPPNYLANRVRNMEERNKSLKAKKVTHNIWISFFTKEPILTEKGRLCLNK